MIMLYFSIVVTSGIYREHCTFVNVLGFHMAVLVHCSKRTNACSPVREDRKTLETVQNHGKNRLHDRCSVSAEHLQTYGPHGDDRDAE